MQGTLLYHTPGQKERPSETDGLSGYSALFLEAGTAASAGNGDLTLTLGHPQLLGAAGTLEIAVLLVPADGLLQAQPLEGRLSLAHEAGILLPALGDVAGEDPEQTPDKDHVAHQLEQSLLGQRGNEGQNKINTDQKKAELVIAISAVHKSLDRVAHKLPPYREKPEKRSSLRPGYIITEIGWSVNVSLMNKV